MQVLFIFILDSNDGKYLYCKGVPDYYKIMFKKIFFFSSLQLLFFWGGKKVQPLYLIKYNINNRNSNGCRYKTKNNEKSILFGTDIKISLQNSVLSVPSFGWRVLRTYVI